MAVTISDKKVVHAQITKEELTTLLAQKALDAGIADFLATDVQLDRQGDIDNGWTLTLSADRP